jgi:ribosomal protein S18 acetylase RimI-like enzyme
VCQKILGCGVLRVTGGHCEYAEVVEGIDDVEARGTITVCQPWIAGMSGVATAPDFRRKGLASACCTQALDFARKKYSYLLM